MEIEEMLKEQGNVVVEEKAVDKSAENGAGVGSVAGEVVNPDEVIDEGEQGVKKPDADQGEEGSGAEQPAFNVSEHFEGFESIDAINSAIERSKQYTPEVEQELEALRQSKQELDKLQNTVKELKERQPFNDPKFYQLDKIVKENPEQADIFQRYMFGDNSDEGVVKLRMMTEHPKRFKENPGYLQRQLHNKYPAFFSEDPDVESEEYQDDKTALGIAADEAREKFDSEISKVELPAIKKEEDLEAETEEFFKSWKDPFAEVNEAITKLSIPVQDESDNTKNVSFMDYDIPENDLKAVRETAANHIANLRLEPTKENVKEAVDVALGIYLIKNKAKIFTTFANKIQKNTGAEWRKKVNSPEKPGADGKLPGASSGPKEGTGEFILGEIRKS